MRAFLPTHLLLACFSLLSSAQQTCTPVQYELIEASKRPNTRQCETKGKLLAPQAVSSTRVTNINACISACKNTPRCISFGFNRNGTCTLYSKRLIDMDYQQRSTNLGTTFANKLCYQPKDVEKNGNFSLPRLPAGSTRSSDVADWALTVEEGDGDVQYDFDRQCDEDGNGDCYLFLNIEFEQPQDPPQTANVTQQLSCVQVGAAYQLGVQYMGPAYSLSAYLDDEQIFSAICPDDGECGASSGEPFPPAGSIPPVVAKRAKPVLAVVIEVQQYAISSLNSVSFKRVR